MQRLDGPEGRRESAHAGDVDGSGLKQPDHALELFKIPRHQRVGWRDGCHRDADMHRGQREERMIDAVVGEDHQRTLCAHALGQYPGPARAYLLQRIPVSKCRPGCIRAWTLGEKNSLRRLARPVLQPVADTTSTRFERNCRAKDDRAIGRSTFATAGVANSSSSRAGTSAPSASIIVPLLTSAEASGSGVEKSVAIRCRSFRDQLALAFAFGTERILAPNRRDHFEEIPFVPRLVRFLDLHQTHRIDFPSTPPELAIPKH